jgi:hypothetical protein
MKGNWNPGKDNPRGQIAERAGRRKVYDREMPEFTARIMSSCPEVEGRPSKGGGGSSAVDGLAKKVRR